MMTTTMHNFFRIFLLIDGGVILFFALQQDIPGVLNSQVGALSALAVAVGSFLGYRRMIGDQVEKLEGALLDEHDAPDTHDDPYGLFDDTAINDAQLSGEEVKTIFEEEKAKVKERSSVKNIFLTYHGIFSPFRLIAYGALLFGFFWLEGNGHLQIIPYLVGLATLPAATLLSSFFNR
jgi:hypothetical protein